MRLNPLALGKLEAPKQENNGNSDSVYAYIEVDAAERGLSTRRYDFLVNPSSIEVRTGANLESLPSNGTNVPRIQFRYGEAQTLTLNGVLMLTPGNRQSLKPLLDAGIGLCRITSALTSPIVSFVWGSRRFSPAMVQSFEFTETMWTSTGEPTRAEGKFTLVEVPPVVKPSTETQTSSNAPVKSSLTPRLLEQGSNGASKWLTDNSRSLPESLRQIVQRNAYKLSTDAEGVISMLDSNGVLLRTIGQNIRGTFTPEK